MPLKPRFLRPICRDIRQTVSLLCKELASITDIRHDIEVVVAPAPALKTIDGKFGFGCFSPSTGQIYLAGAQPDDIELSSWQDLVAETLCHELVHYEQWRDGRNFTERGVEVRARNLLAKTSYEHVGATVEWSK